MDKPRKKYRPKAIMIPMTQSLYDDFGMQMHTALATLRTSPNPDAWDALGWLFNVVFVTVKDDDRFADQIIHLQSGIRMMNQLLSKCEAQLPLKDYEVGCLTSTVCVIDSILPRLDVTKLHLSNLSLRKL